MRGHDPLQRVGGARGSLFGGHRATAPTPREPLGRLVASIEMPVLGELARRASGAARPQLAVHLGS